ncbi:hypothetical protein TNCV_2361171 [Trichonephila clavipes]|nr:hypothetical protein TNCV_2361171 [Trichonephila clavipes]
MAMVTDSWPVYHEFEPSTIEIGLVAGVTWVHILVQFKTCRVEGPMYDKSVEVQCPPIGVCESLKRRTRGVEELMHVKSIEDQVLPLAECGSLERGRAQVLSSSPHSLKLRSPSPIAFV